MEKIRSVGIDIGTSTTQFVVSMLTLKNVAPGSLVPKMEITDKEVLYRSAIHMTPIGADDLVDSQRIFSLIGAEFAQAGIRPEDIDTGAVIITGETAKKENAKAISGKVAGFAGDFVVATAGGKLESIIAGKGSGAADYSRANHSVVANIDIGGGTANIGVFKNGHAFDSICINVGGRLLQLEQDSGRIELISAPMRKILEDLGISARVGERLQSAELTVICDRMCQVILECLSDRAPHGLALELLMTGPLRLDYAIDQVMISGGVADFVYTTSECATIAEITRFGDIGPLFGSRLRELWPRQALPLVKPVETIRATVIGAGAQTVDVSGSTILVDGTLLPFKNVPVALVPDEIELLPEEEIAGTVRQSIVNYFEAESLDYLAIGLRGTGYLSFLAIQKLAKGILAGARTLIEKGRPLIVVLEQDIGKVLGQSLKFNGPTGLAVVCIDQLVVQEGDFIDIGRPMAGGTVVPVVIKSLVFETKQK
jgi:ethanolamine utilization protein EutA